MVVQLCRRLVRAVSKESLCDKGLLSLEHVIGWPFASLIACPCILDGPTEFLRDDQERLGLSVLADQFLVETFGVLLISQKEDGSLAERPLEVGVADLVVAAAGAFTGRLVSTFDQTSIGNEVSDLWEAVDVVDLVENHQREDRTHAGDRLQQMISDGVMMFGLPLDLRLEIEQDPVVDIEKMQICLNALLCAGLFESLGQSSAVRGGGDALAERWIIVLRVGVLYLGQ